MSVGAVTRSATPDALVLVAVEVHAGERKAAGLAQVFNAHGDPVRLRLVSLIGAHHGGEVCVCELTTAFDLTQPTISHHLKVLREAGIIDGERRGTWVYYWLVPAALERIAALLSAPAQEAIP